MTRKTATAHIVRVVRNKAGVEIPFDRIYLFQKQDQHLLPKIFRDAMVFPLTKKFVSQIEKVLKDYTAPYVAFPYLRGREHSLRKSTPLALGKDLRALSKEYVALVPVLFTTHGLSSTFSKRKGRKKDATFPAYLVAKPDTENTLRNMRAVVSAKAYFIIDGREIRPICLMCPKHQDALQGACHLGELDCYRFLARAKRSDLVRGVKLYDKLTAGIKEPDLDLGRSSDVKLQRNSR